MTCSALYRRKNSNSLNLAHVYIRVLVSCVFRTFLFIWHKTWTWETFQMEDRWKKKNWDWDKVGTSHQQIATSLFKEKFLRMTTFRWIPMVLKNYVRTSKKYSLYIMGYSVES